VVDEFTHPFTQIKAIGFHACELCKLRAIVIMKCFEAGSAHRTAGGFSATWQDVVLIRCVSVWARDLRSVISASLRWKTGLHDDRIKELPQRDAKIQSVEGAENACDVLDEFGRKDVREAASGSGHLCLYKHPCAHHGAQHLATLWLQLRRAMTLLRALIKC
jgi:hypothetical protein